MSTDLNATDKCVGLFYVYCCWFCVSFTIGGFMMCAAGFMSCLFLLPESNFPKGTNKVNLKQI